MRYYDTLAEYDRDGFNVIVDKTWEDLSPRDCFDDAVTDIDDICRKIDNHDLDWFMLRVRVMHEDIELAVDYCGGFLYADAREVLTDGTAEDIIAGCLATARERVPELILGLSRLVDKTAA
jgi:hypothetical protein